MKDLLVKIIANYFGLGSYLEFCWSVRGMFVRSCLESELKRLIYIFYNNLAFLISLYSRYNCCSCSIQVSTFSLLFISWFLNFFRIYPYYCILYCYDFSIRGPSNLSFYLPLSSLSTDSDYLLSIKPIINVRIREDN